MSSKIGDYTCDVIAREIQSARFDMLAHQMTLVGHNVCGMYWLSNGSWQILRPGPVHFACACRL